MVSTLGVAFGPSVAHTSTGPPPPYSLGYGARTPVYARPPQPGERRWRGPHLTAPVATPTASPSTANALAVTTVAGDHATFDISYDSGFAAHPEAEAAFNAAAKYWADRLYSPVDIQVQATFHDMGDPSILGSAGPNNFLATIPGGRTNTAYPVALADAMTGNDYEGTAPDIVAEFNSAFPSWYYATDSHTPRDSWDFETVVTHELAHGIGFISSFSADGDYTGDGANRCPAGKGCFGEYPSSSAPFVFDRFLTTGATGGTPLLSNPQASDSLEGALTSGNVYWSGTQGIAGAGGERPELYAPSPWEPGSSGSHLDEDHYPKGSPNSLMTPIFDAGEVQHGAGPVALGVIDDLGWNVNDRYVIAAYHDFLGRAPSGDELSFSATALSSGAAGRYSFVYAVANSTEWVSNIVTGFYHDTLGRDPDDSGLAYWTDQIRSGRQSVAQVAAMFYSSNEYFQATGGDLAGWVKELYQDLLGRPADSDGVTYWVGVAQDNGRPSVAYALYQSSESRRSRVRALYQKLLVRDPDASGLDYWSQQVLTAGDVALAAQLATSNEYFNRAQARTYT